MWSYLSSCSSRLCKEHFEAAKAITAKLGIPEPPSSGTASVPSCSCSGCDEPQYDRRYMSVCVVCIITDQMRPFVCLAEFTLALKVYLSSLLCSSRLCQQHFEMGCRIKSKLAISPEISSLPCSAQSRANPAQLVNQNVPRNRTSSGVGDNGLNNQTSMDFAIALETQKVRFCVVDT